MEAELTYFLKKQLTLFLKDKNKSIKKLSYLDFHKFITTTKPNFELGLSMVFFEDEKDRVILRDQKYESTRKKKTITFNLDEYKLIEIKMKESGISDFSNFAKTILFQKKIISKVDKDLIFQLNKIGNNLNQIAKAVNQDSKKNVLTELVEIEKAIKALGK